MHPIIASVYILPCTNILVLHHESNTQKQHQSKMKYDKNVYDEEYMKIEQRNYCKYSASTSWQGQTRPGLAWGNYNEKSSTKIWM